MTKRISLAAVLVLLTIAPVAAAEGFENPLAGVGKWLKGIATAVAEMGGLQDPFGAPQGDEMGGEIDLGGDPEPDGDGDDEMVGHMDPRGAPEPMSGDGDEMGGEIDPFG